MASVKNKDIPEEYEFFAEYFKFRKKYYRPEDTDEYWKHVIDEADQLHKKYHNRYLDQLILVCVDDIDKRYQDSTGGKFYIQDKDLLTAVYERLNKDGQGNKASN